MPTGNYAIRWRQKTILTNVFGALHRDLKLIYYLQVVGYMRATQKLWIAVF